MHPCSKTPSLKGAEDAGCLETLTSTFSFIYRIGDKETASASLVFKLSQKSEHIAIKVIPLREESDLKDIKIACLLNGLLDENPIFVRTFGWIKCKQIPRLWLEGLNMKEDVPEGFTFKKGKENYIFQIMDFTSYAWTDKKIRIGLEEYRVMLFLLLHGLWLANTRFGFKHNDIHQGQILFQTCKPNTTVSVSMGENDYTIECQRFVPKLIDFGLSSLGSDSDEESSGDDDSMFESEVDGDLAGILYTFEERMKQDGLKPFKFPPVHTLTMEDVLLKDPVFMSLRNRRVGKIESKFFCDVCSSQNAQVKWENSNVKFCDEECAYKWNEISKMIK